MIKVTGASLLDTKALKDSTVCETVLGQVLQMELVFTVSTPF